jgi:hypothetical protein
LAREAPTRIQRNRLTPREDDGRLELQPFPMDRNDSGANLTEHCLDCASTRQRPDPERFISFRPKDEDGPDVARRYVVLADGDDRLPS